MFSSFKIGMSKMIIDDEKVKEYRMWHFKKTDKISTYLFNLCVGPYREIKNESNNSVIPMSLFCRSNLHDTLEK
jgi:aminopeptidase N